MVSSRYGDNNPYAAPDTEIDNYHPFEGEMETVQYAGFWQRFVAFFIDTILTVVILVPALVVVFMVVYLISDAYGLHIDPDEPQGEAILNLITLTLNVLVGWLYFSLQDSSINQASIGKRMMGLRIVDEGGRPISFMRATGRHFAKFLSCIFMIGYLSQPFHEKKQTIHDRLAGTLVIRA